MKKPLSDSLSGGGVEKSNEELDRGSKNIVDADERKSPEHDGMVDGALNRNETFFIETLPSQYCSKPGRCGRRAGGEIRGSLARREPERPDEKAALKSVTCA